MQCRHLRHIIARTNDIDVHRCAERQCCTQADHGMILTGGEPMPVCATCPLAPAPINDSKKLTIGMAYYRDWPGLWATIKSLQLHHADVWPDLEIVVVDNDLDGKPDEVGERNHSWKAKQLCHKVGAKYDHFTKVAGTAAAKGRIFDLATAPSVLVLDCHVLLPLGTVAHLIKHLAATPDSKDLWQGPCIGDGGIDDVVGTHFTPNWGSLMYGTWGINQHSLETGEPFEIDMQGCGLFCCHRAAWPGFHPLLQGFGPEEFHLHQRIRRNGGKCWSLPWLRWCHRFGNPSGSPVPGISAENRLRGHLITHLDTRAPALTEIRRHFVDDTKALTNETFFRVLRETVAEFWPDRQDLGAACQHRQPFLTVVNCEVGCHATRAPLPIFACGLHGQCSPWVWRSVWKDETPMPVCLTCADRTE